MAIDSGLTNTEIVEALNRGLSAVTGSAAVRDILTLTQAEYDAIETKSATTVYLVTE